MARSALLNVMVQAAVKAGRGLSRDFGEVQNLQVSLKGPGDYVSQADRKAEAAVDKARDEMSDENATLRGLISDLAMPVLPRGIQTRSEALFALGFPPSAVPDVSTIRRRWRRMAMIYHPDSAFGDHDRMSQLNQALEKLTQ